MGNSWFSFVIVMANGYGQCVSLSNERKKKYIFVIEDGFKRASGYHILMFNV
jgi:hypothetical protein